MQDVLSDFLAKRKNRCIAIVMGVKERECDLQLNAQASQKLRKVILDQFNDFYDSCMDVMSSLDTGEVVLNEEYVRRLNQKLDEVHEAVVGRNNGSYSADGPARQLDVQ